MSQEQIVDSLHRKPYAKALNVLRAPWKFRD